MPVSAWMSLMSCRICAWIVTSSAVVGSSAISTDGSQRERHGDHHPLQHAARELVRVVADDGFGILDLDALEERHRPVERLLLRDLAMGADGLRRSGGRW